MMDEASSEEASQALAAEMSAAAPAQEAGKPVKLRPDQATQTPPPKAGGAKKAPKPFVSFDRRELDQILRVYGRRVASGEWRDYAIDHLKERAVFSIFRRASEAPLYRIEKDPALARRQGAYSVVGQGGLILKRGHDLEKVLRVLDKRKHLSLVAS